MSTIVEQLADFAADASYDDLSTEAREQLKIRVLDSLACAIGAVEGEPVRLARAQIDELGGAGRSSLIGGGSAAPDRAAFYNSALVRYLDFNDSYAVSAGVARALGLDAARTAHAIAIAGAAFNALRVTRTGRLSQWKGLAYPNMAGVVTRTTLLARCGITGPLEVFEGEKGFRDAVTGYFELDWPSEDLERVTRTVLKTMVRTKEEADHSLHAWAYVGGRPIEIRPPRCTVHDGVHARTDRHHGRGLGAAPPGPIDRPTRLRSPPPGEKP